MVGNLLADRDYSVAIVNIGKNRINDYFCQYLLKNE